MQENTRTSASLEAKYKKLGVIQDFHTLYPPATSWELDSEQLIKSEWGTLKILQETVCNSFCIITLTIGFVLT